MHHDSSSDPGSRKRAEPQIVVEMLESALVFKLRSRLANDDRVAAGGGDPSRSPWGLGARVGGRCETQSCTKSETRGFDMRWFVLRDAGLVVMIIVGYGSKGVDGRYV